jgi:tetratricopeptide (TPR) repeat protein
MDLMAPSVRVTLTLILCAAGSAAPAQIISFEDIKPLVPARPTTKRELDRAEALKVYGLALMHEKQNHLIEALKTFQEAERLDPESVAPTRALIPLYLAVDRIDSAFAACEKVLDLSPDDFEIGYLYARQLRNQERSADALAVLKKLAARPALKDSAEMLARVHYDLGLLHEARQEWPQAAAAYRQVVAVLDHPAHLIEEGTFTREELTNQAAETYERLGRVCLKRQQIKEATAAFDEARKRDPLRAARLSYNLAEVHVAQGEPGEALIRLNEYLASMPEGTDGYELRIKLLRQLNRGAEVVPQLEEAAGRDRHNAALKLLLAREYRLAGRLGDAERVCEELSREKPTPEVYREMFAQFKADARSGPGRLLQLLDQTVEKGVGKDEGKGDSSAAARARAMLLVLRDDAELTKMLLQRAHQRLQTGPPLNYHMRVLFAGLAARARLLEPAEAMYRSCLEQRGSRPGDNEHEVYTGLLRVLVLARKHQAIVEVCKQGLDHAQATNRVVFYLEMAQALMKLDRPKEALAAADDAVNISGDKERLLCRRNRAFLLSQAGKHADAIAECQALLKEYNQPGDVHDIRLVLASIYSAAKMPALAEEQLLRVLEGDPNDATANNDLGYLWAEQSKRLDEAEKMIRKALELDKKQRQAGIWVGLDADQDNAAYTDSLGWVLFRRGKLAEAIGLLEKASRLPGGLDDPVVWDHLGDAYFRHGDRDRALGAWKKAQELFEEGQRRPDEHYKEIKEKLRQLTP